MLHVILEKGPWFRAKKYGYGAGLPFKWQGWATIGLYLMALVPSVFLPNGESAISQIASLISVVVVTVIFLVIVRSRTEGGWKWRGDFGS